MAGLPCCGAKVARDRSCLRHHSTIHCRDQLGVTSHGVETPPMEMFRFACIRACGNKWGSAGPCVQLNYRRPRVHRSRFAALARGMTPAGQWTSTSTQCLNPPWTPVAQRPTISEVMPRPSGSVVMSQASLRHFTRVLMVQDGHAWQPSRLLDNAPRGQWTMACPGEGFKPRSLTSLSPLSGE